MDNMAKQKFIIACAQKQVIAPEEQEALKLDILNAIPPAIKTSWETEGADEYQMAADYFDTYWNAKGSAKPQENDPTKTSGGTSLPTETGYTAEQKDAILQYMDSNAQATGERAAKTRVMRVLFDKPVLSEIIAPNAVLTPNNNEKVLQNFDKWEKELVPGDDDNKNKFFEIKRQVTTGAKMPVYVNPKQLPKIIGYQLATTDDNGQSITLNLTKAQAVEFLAIRVQGFVQARDQDSIGIKLAWVARKKAVAADNENGANQKAGTSVVRIINRNALNEHPEYKDVTCAIAQINDQQSINDQFTARSEAFFLTTNGDKNSKGELKTMKRRVVGKTSVYRVERKPEYVNDFGPAVKQKGTGMSKKEKDSIKDALINTFGSGLQSSEDMSNEMRTVAAAIRQNMAQSKGFR